MKNARFWTGVVILMSPVVVIVIATAADRLRPVASVEGRVMYQGRPLRGGMICLVSQDREQSGDMIGRIDQHGRFACRPRWWQSRTSQTRFRIQLCPDPRPAARQHMTAAAATSPPIDESAADPPRRPGGGGVTRRVVLAAMPSSSPIPIRPTDRPAAAGKGRDAGRKALEVSLGSGPVHIDIDL